MNPGYSFYLPSSLLNVSLKIVSNRSSPIVNCLTLHRKNLYRNKLFMIRIKIFYVCYCQGLEKLLIFFEKDEIFLKYSKVPTPFNFTRNFTRDEHY